MKIANCSFRVPWFNGFVRIIKATLVFNYFIRQATSVDTYCRNLFTQTLNASRLSNHLNITNVLLQYLKNNTKKIALWIKRNILTSPNKESLRISQAENACSKHKAGNVEDIPVGGLSISKLEDVTSAKRDKTSGTISLGPLFRRWGAAQNVFRMVTKCSKRVTCGTEKEWTTLIGDHTWTGSIK